MSDHEQNYEDVSDFEETEPENNLPTTTAPALTPAKLANFKKLAAETANRLGALIKFNKGEWTAGDDVINGERRIAHIDQLARGWIKFKDGKVVDRRIGKVVDGFVMPKREELGDNNEAEWNTDAAGNPRDPWVQQYFLPLCDPTTNAVAIYVTSSDGGITAIGGLSDVFAENAQNGVPIVRLAASSYMHKNKEIGRVKVPDLQVVGWTGKPTLADALDDTIPF
jgi:hypothetical protein